jgi:hypothetical protein
MPWAAAPYAAMARRRSGPSIHPFGTDSTYDVFIIERAVGTHQLHVSYHMVGSSRVLSRGHPTSNGAAAMTAIYWQAAPGQHYVATMCPVPLPS